MENEEIVSDVGKMLICGPEGADRLACEIHGGSVGIAYPSIYDLKLSGQVRLRGQIDSIWSCKDFGVEVRPHRVEGEVIHVWHGINLEAI